MKRTMGSSSSTKISLKLLIDKSSGRVLFAEAGKDFVDFLFGLLQLPVGAILSLLVERGMGISCSIGKVYNAVESIDPLYFQTNQTKTSLLNPKCHTSTEKQSPLLAQFRSIGQPSSPRRMGFASYPSGLGSSSSSLGGSFASYPSGLGSSSFPFEEDIFSSSPPRRFARFPSGLGSARSPSCLFGAAESFCVSSSAGERVAEDGYVKGMTTYMVMDDLTVKPMSTISCISILNMFQVKDMGCLKEKTIEIDMKMALKLIKASFESTTVLTDVLFLRAEETKKSASNV